MLIPTIFIERIYSVQIHQFLHIPMHRSCPWVFPFGVKLHTHKDVVLFVISLFDCYGE